MKKVLLLLVIVQSMLFGYNYDDLLIKAQTTLFPKLLLLDKNLEKKLVDGKIVYLVAYEENDLLTAMQISDLLRASAEGQFNGHQFEARLITYAEITDDVEATAIYALSSQTHIERVSEIAMSKGIITFAYDIKHLKSGLLFSLIIEKSMVLYLAKNSMERYDVDFVDVLYQIVRFVDE